MADLWGGFPDYYGVLRVAPDASDVEVRDAWRAAAKRWHPDTTRERDASAMMRRVNEAWQVLGDRDARAVYDEVYFAWRTGSEQLAVELSGRLDMQRERRQARAGSAEWGRWGREDRGRWGREGEEHGRAGNAWERTGTAGARAGGGEGERGARQERERRAGQTGDARTRARDETRDAPSGARDNRSGPRDARRERQHGAPSYAGANDRGGASQDDADEPISWGVGALAFAVIMVTAAIAYAVAN